MANNIEKKKETTITVVEEKREELAAGLTKHKDLLEIIPVKKQEQFKKNFLELATQEYLLNTVSVKEIIRFAVNISKIGLDLSPVAKEVYIVPFDTKVNGTKVMLPQAIIPMNGMQQLAYDKGFFLLVDPVFKFDDESFGAARELQRFQQAKLRTATSDWVEVHCIGFDVVLRDLKEELPEQVGFVDINYIKEATKTIKDERWKIQTWRHKAVRRAYSDFVIPKTRRIGVFEELEELNDSVLKENDIKPEDEGVLTEETETSIKKLGLSLIKKDGMATIQGATFGKEQIIKKLGFIYKNKVWFIKYEPEAKPKTKKRTPASELTKVLMENGLTIDQVGHFVKNTLKLTRDDEDGIEEVLDNKEALDLKIKEFLKTSGNEDQQSLF